MISIDAIEHQRRERKDIRWYPLCAPLHLFRRHAQWCTGNMTWCELRRPGSGTVVHMSRKSEINQFEIRDIISIAVVQRNNDVRWLNVAIENTVTV
jgi:hypothetical protein